MASWSVFPHDIARADLTGDVVNAAGAEERVPWNLAPLRALAILCTVGLGAPMGTESPAAPIGVATGSWLGRAVPALRGLTRLLAIGGGAASVSALIGIPLVGSLFMVELAKRRQIPLNALRAAAVLAGGCGGVFVPFLAIGDLSGRVFAELSAIPGNLAGAAGAAAGIAGGYRLPLTALAMVMGVGGPDGAKITCLATVAVAALSGLLTARAANALSSMVRALFREDLPPAA